LSVEVRANSSAGWVILAVTLTGSTVLRTRVSALVYYCPSNTRNSFRNRVHEFSLTGSLCSSAFIFTPSRYSACQNGQSVPACPAPCAVHLARRFGVRLGSDNRRQSTTVHAPCAAAGQDMVVARHLPTPLCTRLSRLPPRSSAVRAPTRHQRTLPLIIDLSPNKEAGNT